MGIDAQIEQELKKIKKSIEDLVRFVQGSDKSHPLLSFLKSEKDKFSEKIADYQTIESNLFFQEQKNEGRQDSLQHLVERVKKNVRSRFRQIK